MLLWKQSNGKEASDVYTCCSYVDASICMLDICWEEIHLDRLGHFGYSVACLQACCLTLSCQSNWVPHLCFKVSPCRSFCSQKPSQRHSLGRLAAPNKDYTKGRNVAPNSQTSCVLRTSGKLKGLFLRAIVFCWRRTHKEPSQSRRWASWHPQKCADLKCSFRDATPKHSPVIPMFRLGFAWWPSDEWTFVMEFIADSSFVRVLWSISQACRNRQEMRHTAVSQLNSSFFHKRHLHFVQLLKAVASRFVYKA